MRTRAIRSTMPSMTRFVVVISGAAVLICSGESLGAPAVDTGPAGWTRWARSAPAELVIIDVVRLVGIIFLTYLAALLVLRIVAAAFSLPRLLTTVELCTLPALRPLVGGIVSLSLTASSAVVLPIAAFADGSDARGTATMEVVADSPTTTTATATAPLGGDSDTAPLGGDTDTAPLGGDSDTAPLGGDSDTAPLGGDSGTAVMRLVPSAPGPTADPAPSTTGSTTQTTASPTDTTVADTGANSAARVTADATGDPGPTAPEDRMAATTATTAPGNTSDATIDSGGHVSSDSAIDRTSDIHGSWTIEPGDHLWHVSTATLEDRWGRPPDDDEVLDYLNRLIIANRDVLVVRNDPNLVFTGQVFLLPEVPVDSAEAE